LVEKENNRKKLIDPLKKTLGLVANDHCVVVSSDKLSFFFLFYQINKKKTQMSILNENNSSISTNNILRDCTALAINGFLCRGIKPSDHYYRFSQSFPKAFQLLSTYSNLNNSSVLTTPKHSHHAHSLKHQRTTTTNVPPLDLSSLNSNILLEQQPVSTIMTTNSTGITIKTKKPVYSPKDVKS